MFVTGVVLANASLDVAMHDKELINLFFTSVLRYFNENSQIPIIPSTSAFFFFFKPTIMLSYNDKKFYSTCISDQHEEQRRVETKEYIQQFWVGLLEGDGTITVDSNSKANEKNLRLRVRLVISLLNNKENHKMLLSIQSVIGGRVVIERKEKYITWIASNNEDLIKAFAILAKYPLFTLRKQAQLQFAKDSLIDSTNFLEKRKSKYVNFVPAGARSALDILNEEYFKAWLSGFIEAEGNFSYIPYPNGKIHKAGFSIGQNSDRAIIEKIRDYFNSKHTIIKDKNKLLSHYRISMYGPENRMRLRNHFAQYPLLGAKAVSYKDWIIKFEK